MLLKRKKREDRKDAEAEFKYCLELVKEQIQEQLDVIMVNALKRASERPSKWWEWLFLIIVGIMGGVGLGLLIAHFALKPQIIMIPGR